MGIFFVYILKSSVCLAIFYLFYRLLLSRETFHRFNRFALLGILLLSALLPLIEVSVQQESEVHHTMITLEQWLLLADAMNMAETGQAQEMTLTWIQIALFFYLAGILFFVFRSFYSLIRLITLLKSGEREYLEEEFSHQKEVVLIVHRKDIPPFSWMKYIVISRKDLQENGREILIHELAHIRNRHSLDLLVADICVFFQWFNPASWLLKQELQNIHEYEADESVIKEGVNAKQYQLLLIKKAVGTRLYSMANSFNHSKLKKRITMMLKEKSSPWARLKYLYILPVAAVAVTAFARPEISETTKEISAVKVNDLAAIVETKVAESEKRPFEVKGADQLPGDSVKPSKVKFVSVESGKQSENIATLQSVAEEMPEFTGGGMPALLNYLKENMHYPESARKAGKQGRVTVQFVVDKDGSIHNAKVLRSVDKAMDAEAIRLINAMPKWIPGRRGGEAVAMKYTVPVLFSLDKENVSTTTVSFQKIGADGNMPLYIVDGKELSPSNLTELNSSDFKSMTILKGKSAIELYGKKGKNGVILITLKDKKSSANAKKGNFKLSDKTIYIDGVKANLEDNRLEDLVSEDNIKSVEVHKETTNGEGKIYITTKIATRQNKNTASGSSENGTKVEGKVVDEKGKPISGAAVVIEGTHTGTITDTNGSFVISVSDKDAILSVSFIDKSTVKIKAAPKAVVILKAE